MSALDGQTDDTTHSMLPPAINLGCGDDYREGWLNVDIDPTSRADRVVDLEDTPWPLPSDHFEHALVDNVFEHIAPRKRGAFIQECHRILAPDGILVMRLPVPDIGVGWDDTHHPIPSWRWPLHPRWRDHWDVEGIEGSRVGVGRALPEVLARFATRHWLIRGVDQVEVRCRPVTGHGEEVV